MNHEEAARYLDDLGERIPDRRPPMPDLIRSGQVAERRKTRTTLALVAASVVLILGGAAVVQQVTTGDNGDQVNEPPADVPRAPAGQRLVGLGQVVVAVPESWGTEQTKCGQPTQDTVFFNPVGRDCLVDQAGISSVLILDLDSAAGREVAEVATTESAINGVEVLRGPPECPPTAVCEFPYQDVVVIPDQGVVFAVPEGGDQSGVLDSLQLLPDGYTTVPYVARGTQLNDAKRLLRNAGLNVNVNGTTDALSTVLVTAIAPGPGSVISAGGTVTIDSQVVGIGQQLTPENAHPTS